MLFARLDLEGVLLNEVEINAFGFCLAHLTKGSLRNHDATFDGDRRHIWRDCNPVFESSASIGFEDTHE